MQELQRASLGPLRGHALAWGGVVALQALLLALRLPRALGPRTWLAVQGTVLAHTLALALLLSGALALWRRWGVGPRWLGWALAFLGLGAPTLWAMRDDLSGLITRLPAQIPPALWWLLGAALTTVLLLVGYGGARWVGRGRLRWLALGVAAALVGANATYLPLAYPGLHLVSSVGAGLIACGALEGAGPRRSVPRWASAAALLALLGAALLGVLVRPANRTLLELSHQPLAALVPFIAPLYGARSASFQVPLAQRPWFVDRARLAPVPPSSPSPLPAAPIVLLLGVDSLRADVLADERHRRRLPHLFALRDAGVWFRQARAAGTSTAPSLAALFASRYYSQLRWTEYTKRRPEVFPHDDPSPRFAELVAAQGVPTLTVDTTGWLTHEYGIVRGFQEQISARVRAYPTAEAAGRSLRAQLARQAPGPLLAFVHFLDAHAPYDCGPKPRGAKRGAFEAYLSCLERVDEELGRLRSVVAERTALKERVVWMIFADHGEAFGEHGVSFHASTLYDELLRVPLLVVAPGLRARHVEEPVSLVDVGPTVLDAYGLSTPALMMGQSLLPLLAGRPSALTRPILAEAQLKRAWITPEGTKVIADTRRGTLEIYDLGADPRELDNLAVSAPGRHAELPGTLAHFFDVHTYRSPGYVVPFRRW